MTHKELTSMIGTTQNGVTIVGREKNASGKYVYRVRYNGQEFIKYRATVANMIQGRSRAVSVVPKSQHVTTASNKGKVITYRFNTRGMSRSDVQAIAYRRIDAIRDEIRRLEREADLTLTLIRDAAFDIEQAILQAQAEEQAAAKKAEQERRQAEAQRMANRAAILQRYIDTYDSRVVNTMLKNMQQGQVLLLQKAERISRAQALIAELTK